MLPLSSSNGLVVAYGVCVCVWHDTLFPELQGDLSHLWSPSLHCYQTPPPPPPTHYNSLNSSLLAALIALIRHQRYKWFMWQFEPVRLLKWSYYVITGYHMLLLRWAFNQCLGPESEMHKPCSSGDLLCDVLCSLKGFDQVSKVIDKMKVLTLRLSSQCRQSEWWAANLSHIWFLYCSAT